MDKVVVDSSIVIKWFVVEPFSAESHRILNSYQTGALALLAPDLLYAEVGNIVWKKHKFQGLALADAQRINDEFRLLSFSLTSTRDLLKEAYRLAVTYQRTVYDALYIALSVDKQCPFVTADEKLVNALHPALPNVIWIANWT
jgi:predicted nucleic acid-binding protein